MMCGLTLHLCCGEADLAVTGVTQAGAGLAAALGRGCGDGDGGEPAAAGTADGQCEARSARQQDVASSAVDGSLSALVAGVVPVASSAGGSDRQPRSGAQESQPALCIKRSNEAACRFVPLVMS